MIRYTILTVALTLVVLTLAAAGDLRPVGDALSDLRFRLSHRDPTGSVVLVDVDERSIAALQTWPWPRSVHARIIDRLRDLGASAIAFDVDFSAASSPAEDDALEAALKRADGSVILAALMQRASARGGADTVVYNRPLARLAANAWEASVNVYPDRDGLIRSFSRGELFGDVPLPSIPTLFSDAPEATAGTFLIDFSIDASKFDHISAIDLLHGTVDRARVNGKKIIVGSVAVELRDFVQVPVYGAVPGPLLQALAADSLIQGRAMHGSSVLVSALGLAAICCLVIVLQFSLRWIGVIVALLGMGVAIEAAALLVQMRAPLILDTSAWQVELGLAACLVALREIDLRAVLLAVARYDTRKLQTILDRVIHDNFAGIVVVDRHGRIQSISKTALATIGRDPTKDFVGRHYAEVLPQGLATAMEAAMAQARDGVLNGQEAAEVRLESDQGDATILEYVATASLLPMSPSRASRDRADHMALCLTFQDVTARNAAQARIAHMARFDALTGLPNRHAFLERSMQLFAAGPAAREPVVLLLFDLDRFKLVNDRLGHGRGDMLLCAVGQRLGPLLAQADMMARLGGDEFGALVIECTEGQAMMLARSLIEALSLPYELDGFEVSVGASVGLARTDGDDVAVAMRHADAALYQAKAEGGNVVRVYDAAMEAAALRGKRLEQELIDALREGQFEVRYQRQVDVASEAIIGVEALLRWHHPQRGTVSPAEFIPIAERMGLIEQLGAWVLHTACVEAAAWPVPIKLSVNLSAVQFVRGDLMASIDAALADSGMPPERLDFEITETIFMEDLGSARTTLERIRRMGIGVSLDDFGTGYSSLSYLKKFPIDKIKIDKSFVTDLPHDQESIAIIRAVVSLADSLGMRVNAEGVETREQMQLLRLLGVREVQGYLHGRPEPAAAIGASLAAQLASDGQAADATAPRRLAAG